MRPGEQGWESISGALPLLPVAGASALQRQAVAGGARFSHTASPSVAPLAPPPAPLCPCSKPGVANDDAKTTPTTTQVVVTPPSLAPEGGWQSYALQFCPTSPSGDCFTKECGAPPQPPPTTTTCQVSGLSPGVQYAVRATAVRGSTSSLLSDSDTFTTPWE